MLVTHSVELGQVIGVGVEVTGGYEDYDGVHPGRLCISIGKVYVSLTRGELVDFLRKIDAETDANTAGEYPDPPSSGYPDPRPDDGWDGLREALHDR